MLLFPRLAITELELSLMRCGSFISPHVDSRNKLLTLMIYLSEERGSDSSRGTRFWRFARPNPENRHLVEGPDLDQFRTSSELSFSPPFDWVCDVCS